MFSLDNNKENRTEACKVLLDVKVCNLIQTCAMLDGRCMTTDNIRATLDKHKISLGGENGDYIRNAAKAINFIKIHYDMVEDFYYVRVLYEMLMDNSELKYQLVCANKSELNNEIHKINQIESPLQRAVVMFGYLIKKGIFPASNGGLAFLVANKILVNNGAGLFLVSGNKLPTFISVVSNFITNDNRMELCNYFLHECWSKVMV